MNYIKLLIKKELKNKNPIKYHELVVSKCMNSYLEYKEKEIIDKLELIQKELRKEFPFEKSNLEYIEYENKIQYEAINILWGILIF